MNHARTLAAFGLIAGVTSVAGGLIDSTLLVGLAGGVMLIGNLMVWLKPEQRFTAANGATHGTVQHVQQDGVISVRLRSGVSKRPGDLVFASDIFCEHANECPTGVCPCDNACPCRERMCDSSDDEKTTWD